ncbi:VOC family protein [Maricurvus nonylphenolicus]|uniref:VOC family protein n=1 Tax=Maricurvus nonylphenolicus TaxID=1008307 RepID=UPI0036F22753
MSGQEKINYVEFAAKDLAATEAFFKQAFGWTFEHYGDDYIAFSNAGLEGGFYQAELFASSLQGSALIVLYSEDLAATEARIEAAGGYIVQETYDFPGGRRFHFSEPSGNEFAVWSDK